jgi:hypothetical protein
MLYNAQRPRFLTGLNSSSSPSSPPSSYTLAPILSSNANMNTVNSSSALVLSPTVQSSFSPTYTQEYVVDETPYPEESDQRPSIMTMVPDRQLELVRHYMVNVMKIQYMQADQSIGPFIYEMIERSTSARDAVCLLSSLHRHCVRDNYAVPVREDRRHSSRLPTTPTHSTIASSLRCYAKAGRTTRARRWPGCT